MRIGLVTPYCLGDPTLKAILGGLAAAYRSSGHEASLAGLSGTESGLGAFIGFLGILRRSDWVHIHGVRGDSIFALWLACELARVPFGLTFHGPARDPACRRSLFRLVLRRARWVSTVCAADAAENLGYFPFLKGRLRVIPNGFALEEQAWGEPPAAEVPFILCAARLAVYKGIDILLMAWKDVCAVEPGVELLVCGRDLTHGHYPRLAQLLGISSRVRFLGEVSWPELRRLMRSSRFFVLPSRKESCPLVVIEAMSAGKAVLATRTGGVPELVEDGKSGLLVSPQDVRALGRGLRNLLADAGLRERLGREAARAAGRYRWDNVAGSYLDLMLD